MNNYEVTSNPLAESVNYQKQQLLNQQIQINNNNNYNYNTEYNNNMQTSDSPQDDFKSSIYGRGSLNESVWTSLSRDLGKIMFKLKIVVLPVNNEEKLKELKQWDLWGPFLICILLGIILNFTSYKTTGLIFSTVFIIMWVGAMIITMNSALLGARLTLMQCICLLGYCTFPSVTAAFLNRILLKFLPLVAKFIIVLISLVWSIKASVPFISQNVSPKKRFLVVYPVMLYFLYLNYFILV